MISGTPRGNRGSKGTGDSPPTSSFVGGAMFEDSLVESQGRIRTCSRWFAIGSFIAQAALLLLFIAFPLFHPQALPRQSMERLLVAPPPPRSPAPPAVRPASTHQALSSLQAQLQAPRAIPDRVSTQMDEA